MDLLDLVAAVTRWFPVAGSSLLANLVVIALLALGLALWATQGMPLVGGALVVAGLVVLVVAELRWMLGRSPR